MREELITPDALLIHGSSGKLVVMFGSVASVFAQVFEAQAFYASRNDDALILRDHSQLAFHGGFRGLTNSFAENIAFLKEMIRRKSPSRVSFVGVSSGAYSAIIHAAHIGIDDVIAINPVTTFDPQQADRLGLRQRLQTQFQALDNFYPPDHPDRYLLDTRAVLERNPGKIKLIGMHYSASEAVDEANAKLIADLPEVETAAHSSDHHVMLPLQLLEQGVVAYHLDTPIEELRQTYKSFA